MHLRQLREGGCCSIAVEPAGARWHESCYLVNDEVLLFSQEERMKHRFLMVVILVFLLVAPACNFPLTRARPALSNTSTPNQTMTALFASGMLGSLTPAASTLTELVVTHALPSATPLLTNTLLATSTPEQSATHTPMQTNTPPPTLTPSGKTPAGNLPTRSGTLVRASYLAAPPTLDGSWDEWNTPAYPAAFITYGRDNWSGEDDLEGSFRVGWDEKHLYLAAKVKDDVYAQNASAAELYLGDSLELLLDTDLYGDFYYNELSYDDYQLGISAGRPDVDGTREAYLWFPSSIKGSRSGPQIAATRSAGVTRIEVAIPWSIFGVTPYSGQRLGFALSISDNDDTGSNEQQSMASSAANRHLLDPTTWGEMQLTW